MRKHYPLNSNGAEDAGQLPWKDGVPSTGVEGSYPGQALFVDTEAEILAAIDASGQTRNGSDLTQLIQAIARGVYLGQFSGTANALAAALPNNVAFASLQRGIRFTGFVTATNTAGVTMALTGIGPVTAPGTITAPVLRRNGTALQAGDLPVNQDFEIRWDGSAFRMAGTVASDGGGSGGGSGSGFVNVLFKALKTANQALNAAQVADVTWQSPAAGSPPSFGSAWDGTTLTIGQAGRYLIHCQVQIAVATGGGYNEGNVHLYKNGVPLRPGEFTGNPGNTTFYMIPQVFTIEDLAVGDQIKARAIANATSYSSGQIMAANSGFDSNELPTVLTILRLS